MSPTASSRAHPICCTAAALPGCVNFLIDRSATILQDDSGIPLAYFDAKQWRLQPFGHYLHPLGIFPNAYQPDMAELFRNAAPLDFGIGYLWRKNEFEPLAGDPDRAGAERGRN